MSMVWKNQQKKNLNLEEKSNSLKMSVRNLEVYEKENCS